MTAAFFQDAVEVPAVLFEVRVVGYGLAGRIYQVALSGIEVRIIGVVGVLSVFAVDRYFAFAQQGKMRRNTRLAHLQNILHFGYR